MEFGLGLRGLERAARAHEEQVQDALCKPSRSSSEVVLFMVVVGCLGGCGIIIWISELLSLGAKVLLRPAHLSHSPL